MFGCTCNQGLVEGRSNLKFQNIKLSWQINHRFDIKYVFYIVNIMRDMDNLFIKQVIYVSKPVGFNDQVLDSIVVQSKKNNEKNQITGALICRSDLYLQYLEGPPNKIDAIYAKIKIDGRHTDVKLLEEAKSKRRLFSNWAMRGDPVKEWMWTQEEVADGVLQKLSKNDAMKIFVQHSREIDQFLS